MRLDCEPPEGSEALLAELPEPLLAEYFAAIEEPAGPEPIAAGLLPRTSVRGLSLRSGPPSSPVL